VAEEVPVSVQSDHLDLAASLVVVFVLASLVVSGLHELLAWATRIRAKVLWAYLHDLTTPDGRALPQSASGTLRLMFLAPRSPAPGGTRRAGGWATTDVRPRAGAAEGGVLQDLLETLRPIDSPAAPRRDGRRTTVKTIPPSTLAQSLLDVAGQPVALGAPGGSTGSGAATGAGRLGGTPLDAALGTFRRTSDGRPDLLRQQLERWLDGELDRLGGLYRRSIRGLLLLLSVVVAVVVNLDAVRLTTDLWRNPGGRAAVAALADQAVAPVPAGGGAGTGAPVDQVRRLCQATAGPVAAATPEAAAAAAEQVRTCVEDAFGRQRGLDVVGRSLLVDPARFADDLTPWGGGTSGGTWLRHLAGVGLTALALFVGAPFWFDVLKRLTGMRAGLVGDT
jgi:hypothetical protein